MKFMELETEKHLWISKQHYCIFVTARETKDVLSKKGKEMDLEYKRPK